MTAAAAVEMDLAKRSLEQERSRRKGSDKNGARGMKALERREVEEQTERRAVMAQTERIPEEFVERIGGGGDYFCG